MKDAPPPLDAAQRLQLEAAAFDSQIEERVANGHIPDLRRVTPCHWFYNNPWREPEYAKLDFGEQFETIVAAIDRHLGKPRRECKLLEVGCGPGYLSLELSRAGFDVTGIDLAPAAIEVAERFAAEDPWRAESGPLAYFAADFFESPTLVEGSYDAVVFLGAMHHFPDQAGVAKRTRALLRTGGIVIGHEPARDKVTPLVASLLYLCKVLLGAGGNLYTALPTPQGPAAIEAGLTKELNRLVYETEDGEKLQSVNDNEAGKAEIMEAVRAHFEILEERDRYAFFHEIIGGLRFDHETNVKVAQFLRDFDGLLCAQNQLVATEFMVVAKKA